MGHIHSVYDTDQHFSINPITRVVTNMSTTKTLIIQYDHNSERFTFELPRYVDGHDMSLCNDVQVHYINIDNEKGERNIGVYHVEDLQTSPEDENVVICSWVISQNATRLVGSLNFLVRFACTTDETIDYAWNTSIFSGITVASGIYNTEIIVEQNMDLLNEWFDKIVAQGEAGVRSVMEAETEALVKLAEVETAAIEKITTAVENVDTAVEKISSAETEALENLSNVKQDVVDAHDSAMTDIEEAHQRLLDEANFYSGKVLQTTGSSQMGVMSQKATTDALNQLGEQIATVEQASGQMQQGLQEASVQMEQAIGHVEAAFTDVYGRLDQMVNGSETMFPNALRGAKEASVVVFDIPGDVSPVGSLGDHLSVKLTGGYYDDTIMISSCEGMRDSDGSYWNVYGDTSAFSIDTQDKTEGGGCFCLNLNGTYNTAGGAFSACHRLLNTKDISEMEYLCFDMHVSDVEQWNGKRMTIELGSRWDEYVQVVQHICTFGALKQGWNRVVIPLMMTDSILTGFCQVGQTDDTYDPRKWKMLRFYNTGDLGTVNLTVKIDNLFFTKHAEHAHASQSKLYLVCSGSSLIDGNLREDLVADSSGNMTVCHQKSNNTYVINGTVSEDGECYYIDHGVTDDCLLLGGQNLTLSSQTDSGKVEYKDVSPATFDVCVRNLTKDTDKWFSVDLHKSSSTTIELDDGDKYALTGSRFSFFTKTWNELVAPKNSVYYNGGKAIRNHSTNGYQIVNYSDRGGVLSYTLAETGSFRFWIENGATDITGLKFVTFDYYVTNLSAIANTQFSIYLPNAEGNWNGAGKLSIWMKKLSEVHVGEPLKDGWNTIRIPVEKFTNTNFDWTNLRGFVIAIEYSTAYAATYMLDNVCFEREADVLQEKCPSFDNYHVRVQLEAGEKAKEVTNYQESQKYEVAADGSVSCAIDTHHPLTHLGICSSSIESFVVKDGCQALSIRAEYNRDINKAFAELMQLLSESR